MFNIDIYISDQARGQDGWILAKFSFFVLMDQDEVDVHQNAKRKPGQYPAILTELARSIYGKLRGRARWDEFCVLIGYLCWQEGPISFKKTFCNKNRQTQKSKHKATQRREMPNNKKVQVTDSKEQIRYVLFWPMKIKFQLIRPSTERKHLILLKLTR